MSGCPGITETLLTETLNHKTDISFDLFDFQMYDGHIPGALGCCKQRGKGYARY